MLHLNVTFAPIRSPLDGRHITARGLHGLLFDVLKKANPAEADWLHHHEPPKPFSLVPLYTAADHLIGLRVAAIGERAATLLEAAWQRVYQQGDVLQLGRYQQMTVSSLSCQPGLSFAELSQLPPDDRLALRFLSPTAFKQGPGSLPLPLPANVFASPYRIWQAFAPAKMGLADRWPDWCAAEVFIVAHRIETAVISISQREQFTGFVGEVWFEAHDGAETYLRIWQALGRLATFCGVGHKTTMGMGAVEMIESV